VFDYGTEPFWRQVHRSRQEMLEEAARYDVSLIYTSVYSHPKDRELAARRFLGVEANGGTVRLVQLTCDRAVQQQRVATAERTAANKVTSMDIVAQMEATGDLYHPMPDRESLRIDNTSLSPDEVARRIVE